MIGFWSIVLGYAAMIWATGWIGAAALVVHVAAMFLFMPKGK